MTSPDDGQARVKQIAFKRIQQHIEQYSNQICLVPEISIQNGVTVTQVVSGKFLNKSTLSRLAHQVVLNYGTGLVKPRRAAFMDIYESGDYTSLTLLLELNSLIS